MIDKMMVKVVYCTMTVRSVKYFVVSAELML